MIVAGSASPLLLSSAGGYNLTKSLRFRSSASAYLNRTPASAGNRRTYTWSGWVKRGILSSGERTLFNAGGTLSDTGFLGIRFTSDDKLDVTTGSTDLRQTTQVFRDPSAWYHIVVAMDTTQATGSNRVKVYLNGTQITAFSTSNDPSLNLDTAINNTVGHAIGLTSWNSAGLFDGYMTEINFIDGQALTPSSFGQTSPTTGVWQPIRYTGTYGTNGFYLPFTDVATTSGSNAGLGKDFSGNGNYWTTNNISVTSGSTYDSMKDVPTLTDADTANYCTLNPLASRSVGTMQNGNLTWKKSDAAGDNYCCASSISIPSSGKWYWEVTVTDGSSGANSIGIIPNTSTTQQTANTIPGDFGITTNAFGYYSDGNKLNAGSSAAYGNSFTSGDVIAVAVDTTNGKIWWSKNGTWQASGDPAAGTNAAFTTLSGSYYAASSVRFNGNQHDYNFGQRPFAYTPPTGFVALNTFNLPTPTIGATASTVANKYFDVSLWTGNGTSQSITNSGSMQPDFVWYKGRSTTYNHGLFDSIRGTLQRLSSNLTSAESTTAGSLTAFNSNGFSVGNDAGANQNTDTYVGWQWRASNTTAVTNTAGSITSTVSANTTAGFSIVTYTGNSTSGATVGHGLNSPIKMLICKQRNGGTYGWNSWHTSLGTNYYIALNSTGGQDNSVFIWDTAGMTSSVFKHGSDTIYMNNSGSTYVAYCFAEVAGYSKFGSYTGNGSTDGPFIFTGFRPRFVFVKNASSTGSWIEFDSSTNPYNEAGNLINLNTSGAEFTTSDIKFDILSNGFKVRQVNSAVNGSGNTLIYAAFAESPFKYANAR